MILAPTLTLSAGSGAAIVRPTFSRDFAGEKTLNNGTGPAITFTRASGGTYFDANGVLQTASNDVPRFDHDPATGNASRGLLIEESRTNSIRNSQAGGSTNGVIGSGGALPTNWGNASGSLTVEVVGTGTSAGLSYVDVKFSGTTNATTGAVYFETSSGVVAAPAQTWVGSYYAALVNGSNTNVSTFRAAFVEYDASNNVLASGNTNHSLTSSLVRYSGGRTVADAGTLRLRFGIGWTHASGVAVDFTLRIAAPQLEQGAFPTSYIPTTTAAATRSADSAVVTPISSFYNQSEGTLFAEFQAQTLTQASGPSSRRILHLDDDGSTNQIFIAQNSTNDSISHGGVSSGTQWNIITGSSITSPTKSIVGFAINNVQAAVGGTLGTPDTSATIPTVTHFRIGRASSSGTFQGHIRKIAYYPRRLSNTLLQQLTT